MKSDKEKQTFDSFADFWPFYLSQHHKRLTRTWHFVGTSMVFLCIAASLMYHLWLLLLAPVLAYGCAWYSHFRIEGNRPATFGHPFWSLRADFRMFGLILTGRIDEEFAKHRLPNEK
ncbi:DUF962 domain-containing protein [Brevibacillus sp. SYP-B805]|uniref:DUF962 domain-containing protein n=1 Tax=Brevibacillus sp. SYP-B805 TaxID=1578199 RepID=UPI0013EB1D4C|nr:DUF962 domain-containing protein [Brevibacillus sp. SYP-B805]NGQ95714.1 DUF962 domain-containing protein [Brevibacillus sp. SYP-B805]